VGGDFVAEPAADMRETAPQAAVRRGNLSWSVRVMVVVCFIRIGWYGLYDRGAF
jgi:hypothetical protein